MTYDLCSRMPISHMHCSGKNFLDIIWGDEHVRMQMSDSVEHRHSVDFVLPAPWLNHVQLSQCVNRGSNCLDNSYLCINDFDFCFWLCLHSHIVTAETSTYITALIQCKNIQTFPSVFVPNLDNNQRSVLNINLASS